MSFSGTNPPSEAGEPFSLPLEHQQTADANTSFNYGGNHQLNSSFNSYHEDQGMDNNSRSVSMQDIRAPYYPSMYYAAPQPAAYAYQAQNVAAFQKWLNDYQRWWHLQQHQRRERERMAQPESERARMTPLRFPHRHSRVAFSGSGQLLVARGTAILVQQIDPGLLDYHELVPITTWPGPLIRGETKIDDVKEYIRVREAYLKTTDSYADSYEKKLLWNLLSMSVVQTGRVSGSDLAELLVSNNENVFTSEDASPDEPMNQLRRYLILGQRKTALDIASKSGLWSHAFALTHFSLSRESRPEAINNVVSKFTNSTLTPDDPLYVLYRCLLKTPTHPVVAETLPQFAILLANDCEVSPSVNEFRRAPELLKLMVALKTGQSQHMVNVDPSIPYSDERVFVNEILEFTRESTEFLEALVPMKLKLIARLFDFGLVNQASRYCLAIRQYYSYFDHYFKNKTIEHSQLNWQQIMDVIIDVECKLYGFDVTKSPESEQQVTPQPASTPPPQQQQQLPSPTRTNSISRHSDAERSLAPLVESAREDIEDDNEADEDEEDEDESSQLTSTNPHEEDPSIEENRSRSASRASLQPDSPVTPHKNEFFIPPPVPMMENSDLPPPLSFVSQPTSPVFPPLSSPIAEDEDADASQQHSTSFNTQLHSTVNQNFSTNNSSFMNSPPMLSPIPPPLQPNGGTHMQSEIKPSEQQQQQQQQLSSSAVGNKSNANAANAKPTASSGGGWFGRIIEKVVPPGPKQAILPDDKNPSIYYDKQLGRWVNKDEPEDSSHLDAIRKGPPRGPMVQSAVTSANNSSFPLGPAAASPLTSHPPPAPTLAPAASMPNLNHNNFSFIKNNKRRPVYVDAWNQQQQKAN